MGLFDNIGQNKSTGQMTFVQEVQAFARVDLNTIFKQGTIAAVSWIANAVKFFHDMFGSNCNHDDNVLMERMIDQIPGMVLVAIKLGWVDPSFIDAYNDNPQRADYTSSNINASQCSAMINPARLLFTVLFGVRIINNVYLDALQAGVDNYYQVDGGVKTGDIPREAVVRAVHLKQTFFPDWMYNSKQWDLNIFQQNPLVAPIPDLEPGKLFTGDILGVTVVNGLVQGSPIPDLPTSSSTPFVLTDPYHPIIYPSGNSGSGGTSPTGTGSTVPAGNIFDQIQNYIKSNPRTALLWAAILGYTYYELEKE